MSNEHPVPGLNFIETFRRQHGRPPRILHIGNVANNAYQNSRLLNALGADCDVICRDYYHTMSCPEWEDADFSGPTPDESRPDWTKIDLNGFKRPEWFAQGPELFCLDYLIARRTKSALERKYWLFLAVSNKTAKPGVLGLAARLERRLKLTLDIASRRIRMFLEPRDILIGWLRERFSASGRDSLNRGVPAYLIEAAATALWLALLPLRPFRKINAVERARLNDRIIGLSNEFRHLFPERADSFSRGDVQHLSLDHKLHKWIALLKHYDLVHAYATEGIIPLLAGKPYVAFEHGTLREIPFEQTPRGRCCALSYRLASHVLITNADNRGAAEKLGIRQYQFVPHVANESFVPEDQSRHALFLKLHEDMKSPFVAFHPPRHHWCREKRLEGDKGNDLFLEGFAKFVRRCEPRATAILVKWGTTIERSIVLIEKLGIGANIRWIPLQPHPAMTRLICSSDLIADQFIVPAFGNMMPKALFCGCPSLVFLDEEKHSWCFESQPPIVNARNADEVYAGLRKIYEDKNFVLDLTAKGREWYGKFHSNRRITEILQTAYESVLPTQDARHPAAPADAHFSSVMR